MKRSQCAGRDRNRAVTSQTSAQLRQSAMQVLNSPIQSIQLLREPALGIVNWNLLVAAVYLLLFGLLALGVATRRLHRKLLP